MSNIITTAEELLALRPHSYINPEGFECRPGDMIAEARDATGQVIAYQQTSACMPVLVREGVPAFDAWDDWMKVKR